MAGALSSLYVSAKLKNEADEKNKQLLLKLQNLNDLMQDDRASDTLRRKVEYASDILMNLKRGENLHEKKLLQDKEMIDSRLPDIAKMNELIELLLKERVNYRGYFNQMLIYRNILYNQDKWDPSFLTVKGITIPKGFMPRLNLRFVDGADMNRDFIDLRTNTKVIKQLRIVSESDRSKFLPACFLLHTANENLTFLHGKSSMDYMMMLAKVGRTQYSSYTSHASLQMMRRNVFIGQTSSKIDTEYPEEYSVPFEGNVLSYSILPPFLGNGNAPIETGRPLTITKEDFDNRFFF